MPRLHSRTMPWPMYPFVRMALWASLRRLGLVLVVWPALLGSAYAQDCPRPTSLPVTAQATPRPNRFRDRIEAVGQQLLQTNYDAIALGDSILQRWPDDMLRAAMGMRTLNAGFGQDTTEDVLWRLGVFDWRHQRPRYVLLLIGTNDISHSGCDIFWGIRIVIDKIHQTFPSAQVIVTSILPRGRDMRQADAKITGVNRTLRAATTDGNYIFLDVHDAFLCDHRTPCNLFTDDLHPTESGYQILGASLSQLLNNVRR